MGFVQSTPTKEEEIREGKREWIEHMRDMVYWKVFLWSGLVFSVLWVLLCAATGGLYTDQKIKPHSVIFLPIVHIMLLGFLSSVIGSTKKSSISRHTYFWSLLYIVKFFFGFIYLFLYGFELGFWHTPASMTGGTFGLFIVVSIWGLIIWILEFFFVMVIISKIYYHAKMARDRTDIKKPFALFGVNPFSWIERAGAFWNFIWFFLGFFFLRVGEEVTAMSYLKAYWRSWIVTISGIIASIYLYLVIIYGMILAFFTSSTTFVPIPVYVSFTIIIPMMALQAWAENVHPLSSFWNWIMKIQAIIATGCYWILILVYYWVYSAKNSAACGSWVCGYGCLNPACTPTPLGIRWGIWITAIGAMIFGLFYLIMGIWVVLDLISSVFAWEKFSFRSKEAKSRIGKGIASRFTKTDQY